MRLYEITEKVRTTKMPARIFEKLAETEIATLSEQCSPDKQTLVNELEQAKPSTGNIFRVPLSDESAKYLVMNSLPDLIREAEDNRDRRLLNSLNRYQSKLKERFYLQ